ALFIHRDEVEYSWTWIDSIQDAWEKSSESPKQYPRPGRCRAGLP
ncbi:MAG: hypothetical protein D3906_07705, partial [Candidatus Electrothrix sp. AUS1_2]|nr:hypothetical protein [Candidatus Electrothrix sp. AUS1_2]